MEQYQLFINGEWKNGRKSRTLQVQNPCDESIAGIVAQAELEDVDEAMTAAHKAQRQWQAMPVVQRANYLKRLIELTIENKEKLAYILTMEQGKCYNEALGEVDSTVDYIRNAIENISKIKGDIMPDSEYNEQVIIEKVPYGVVVALCAWNYPLALVGRKMAPALITGNTVVLKPHELTPLATAEYFKLIKEAGFPKGVVNLITGSGNEIGQELVGHEYTRLVSVTGSVNAGRAIYQTAAKNISGLTLELGGKAPFIVLEDADIDAAVDAAVASRYANCGQVCICCDMIFIQESVKKEFTEKLLEKVKAIKVGNPMDKNTQMGPKMCASDVVKMQNIVNGSLALGAKLLCGGKRPEGEEFAKGFWYTPAVLSEVTMDMPAAKEEIFGPLLPIITIKDFDEAVDNANSSPYGLACYLFTNNQGYIRRARKEIEVGTVFINRALTGYTYVYHNGHKLSGLNGEDGEYGINDFLQKRVTYEKFID